MTILILLFVLFLPVVVFRVFDVISLGFFVKLFELLDLSISLFILGQSVDFLIVLVLFHAIKPIFKSDCR